MGSAVVKNPKMVEVYLAVESKLGRVVGPLHSAVFPHIQVNRFGLIPKPHPPGEWRLIVDLSYRERVPSIIIITPELCLLQYPSVDDAVKVILALGRGNNLAKFDIQSVHWINIVHPLDRHLLVMVWNGQLYICGYCTPV